MKNFLMINGISKNFERTRALDDVSFSVDKGLIFGLLGPNGAGKTTLIRIINRIIQPDKGEIFFDKKKLAPSHIYKIGYLPEERGLYKKMKIGEQILFFARLKGMNKQDATDAMLFWAKRLKITSWLNDKVEELSKGMQQKIQFIITVLHKPDLLIFDEPFTGFDPINVDLIKKQILWLRDQGTTIVFSTHNMASVEEICEKIVLINKGKNILEGNIDNIKSSYFKNLYEISFDTISNDFSDGDDFKIIDNYEQNGKKIFKIELNNNDTNKFLTFATQKGKISTFRPLVPSLHDIFVSEVKKHQNTENE